MAEIKKVLEDAPKNLKKVFKKPYVLAAIGICFLLFFLMRRNNKNEGDYYVPSGLEGYPEMSGSSDTDNSDYINDILSDFMDMNQSQIDSTNSYLNDMINNFNKNFNDYQNSMNDQMSDMYDQIYSNKYNNQANLDYLDNHVSNLPSIMDYINGVQGATLNSDSAQQKARQEALSQMMTNSAMYAGSTDSIVKTQLHAANEFLGQRLGLTYNGGDGLWYNPNGSVAYNTSDIKYNANTSTALEQMRQNSLAWAAAKSDSERKAYYNANQTLGKLLGLNYNSSSGTWTDNKGKQVFNSGGIYMNNNNNSSINNDYRSSAYKKDSGFASEDNYSGTKYKDYSNPEKHNGVTRESGTSHSANIKRNGGVHVSTNTYKGKTTTTVTDSKGHVISKTTKSAK